MVHRWRRTDQATALYTEPELRRIHASFGHPSVTSFSSFLNRASDSKHLDSDTQSSMRKIATDCDMFRRSACPPRRLKLSVGAVDLKFNSRVQVDTIFINNRPVLHVLDETTHFSAGACLRSQSSAEIWRIIQGIWTLIYSGPPDYLCVDFYVYVFIYASTRDRPTSQLQCLRIWSQMRLNLLKPH